MYNVRFVIFNLDYEMDSLNSISNGEDPIPLKLSRNKALLNLTKIKMKRTKQGFYLKVMSQIHNSLVPKKKIK